MRAYYKLVVAGEQTAAGAGLGYAELFGDVSRYHWSREEAEKAAEELRRDGAECRIQERTQYDGTIDDEDDNYALAQLGLPEIES
jgi:hypothetical protein